MITIKTEDGKFFFSSFINLEEEQEATVDETVLSLANLKYLLVAIESGRLNSSEEDVAVLIAAIAAKGEGGSGGGFDPSLVAGKEDKSNKVTLVGVGSDTQYPSTGAVKAYVDEAFISNIGTYDVLPTLGSAIEVTKETTGNDVKFHVYSPRFEDKVRTNPSEFYTQTLVNSVPLYTLTENGEYVLTKPDEWVTLNGTNFMIPSYHISTISDQFAKGIVTLAVYQYETYLRVDITHNVKEVITGYTFECNPIYCRITDAQVPLEFESSTDGNSIYKSFQLPLSTMSEYEDLTLGTSSAHPDVRFTFILKTASGKQTAQAKADGYSQLSES